MILLLDGATHSGKTYIAQKLMEKIKMPYFSLDHLKMGLIRSGCMHCAVSEDEKIKDEMWPIVVGMIKTAIENNQNMIIEGCYIPKNYKSYFEEEYMKDIYSVCLVLSSSYVERNYEKIMIHENAIEQRLVRENIYDILIEDNQLNLMECEMYDIPYILIEEYYDVDKIVSQVIELIGK